MIYQFAIIYPHTTGPELDQDEFLQLRFTIFKQGYKPETTEHTFKISSRMTRATRARTGLSNSDLSRAKSFDLLKEQIKNTLKPCKRIFVLSFSNELEWVSDMLVADPGKVVDLITVTQFMLPEIQSYTRNDLYQYLFKKQMPNRTLQPLLELSKGLLEAIVRKVEFDQRPVYQYFHDLAKIADDSLLSDISQIIKQRKQFNIIQEEDLFTRQEKQVDGSLKNWDNTSETLLEPLWHDSQQETSGRKDTGRGQIKYPPKELLNEMFGKHGVFKNIERYQPRQSQINYAHAVNRSLKKHTVSFIEGGTGIGKSLGYLLPGMELLSRNPDLKIAVSTATKNLQTQVMEREIPKLSGSYGHIRVALLKGKGNYVCLTAFQRAYKQWFQKAQSSEHRLAWIYLLNLLYSGNKGIVDSVPRRIKEWIPGINVLLSETNAATHCKKGFCDINRDYYGRAVKQAADAQLIITNHYKLAVFDEDLMDKIDHFIIDEADQWERSCQNAYSEQINSWEICEFLNRLCGGTRRGYLDLVLDDHKQQIDKRGDKIAPGSGKWINRSFDHVRSLRSILERFNIDFRKAVHFSESRSVYREKEWLMETMDKLRDGELLEDFVASVEAELVLLEMALVKIFRQEHLKQDLRKRALVYQLIVQRLGKTVKDLVLNFATDAVAHSLVVRGSNDFIIRKIQVNIAEIVRQKFYQNDNRIVYTSASLSLDGKFEHFIKAYGAENENVSTSSISSELIVADRTAVYVDESIKPYNYRDKNALKEWRNDIDRAIGRYVLGLNGRSLILFTSYADMRESFSKLQNIFMKHDILPLIQDGSSEEEIDEFRRNEYSVLFGVDRFWSGVDFPGATLSQVIIVKAPNPSLGDPMIKHRNLHEDDFMRKTYGVMSKLKLKQGAGRLIRSEQDRGGIIILDSRYVKSPWLTSQLSVLPVKYRVLGNQQKIMQGVLSKCRLEDEFRSRKLDLEKELDSLPKQCAGPGVQAFISGRGGKWSKGKHPRSTNQKRRIMLAID